MFARTLGLAFIVMAGCAFGLQAVGAQKDKDTPKKKFEVPKDAGQTHQLTGENQSSYVRAAPSTRRR